MSWDFNDSAPQASNLRIVEPSGMRKYYEWRRLIRYMNLPPNDAAARVGDLRYERLPERGPYNFSIRLSQQHRVHFTVDNTAKRITVLSIGPHG
ncbi:hypothetical protein [Hafnia alvei]|uniref:Uncharacterized protein n=1 Tax=Hafnia alvei TaxID=569 RepID=A0A1C6Z3T8_HAFAL|nr:hypothetical protein [Hafnia alvei]NLS55692.1 hypothetical protein [Hafnia alvei]SCM53705.1 hypothetical protein BN1044_03200 [Hafnia alvei]